VTSLSAALFDCIGNISEAEFSGAETFGVCAKFVADVVAGETDWLAVSNSSQGDVDVGMVCVVVGDGDPLDG
jgi:hypothetical protein